MIDLVFLFTVTTKCRSRSKGEQPFDREGEGSSQVDKEEKIFPSLVRGGATHRELNFLSRHEEEYTWFGHLQLEEAMEEGGGGGKFEIRENDGKKPVRRC